MKEKKIIVGVVDGQGAGVGKYIVERLRTELPDLHIRALGTTSLATGKMLKVGADDGASGENAIIYNASQVDIIVGVAAIMMPNALLGEITPRIAEAIGQSDAQKILIPLAHANVNIVLPEECTFQQHVENAVRQVKRCCKEAISEQSVENA